MILAGPEEGERMLKYELMIIWETGDHVSLLYDTEDEAEKVANNFRFAFGNQIVWAATRPKVGDEYFRIEDLKEWLYAISLNNIDQSDFITDLIKRLPGFKKYVQDIKIDNYVGKILDRAAKCITIKCDDPPNLRN